MPVTRAAGLGDARDAVLHGCPVATAARQLHESRATRVRDLVDHDRGPVGPAVRPRECRRVQRGPHVADYDRAGGPALGIVRQHDEPDRSDGERAQAVREVGLLVIEHDLTDAGDGNDGVGCGLGGDPSSVNRQTHECRMSGRQVVVTVELQSSGGGDDVGMNRAVEQVGRLGLTGRVGLRVGPVQEAAGPGLYRTDRAEVCKGDRGCRVRVGNAHLAGAHADDGRLAGVDRAEVCHGTPGTAGVGHLCSARRLCGRHGN